MTRLLIAAIAVAIASSSPLTAQRRKRAPRVQLSAAGQKLEAQYAQEMQRLKTEILRKLPTLRRPKVKAFEKATSAEDKAKARIDDAKKGLGKINSARGLVGHAKGKWIGGADRGIAKAQKQLAKAKTKAERDAARKELAKWQQNRKDGVKALKERQAALDKALRDQPRLEKALKLAQQARERAEARTQQALAALGLGSSLSSERLDALLAKFVVLEEATPTRLAAFAQQDEQKQQLVDRFLADDALLVQMLVADGAADANYGRAFEIYRDIQAASKKAASGNLQRLALATALEHAKPVKQRNAKVETNAPTVVDPVQRYLHFEKAFGAGELDPAFERLSVWDYRMVVNGEEPDKILTWGREMLRNYRPDHITTDDYRWRYVAIVRSDIRYGSQENKFDQDNLQFFQNICKNGGVCGRRAFIGRFILRAFGVPTTARPQRGHAALTHWTPEGWVVCLGAGWGSGWTKTPYNEPRRRHRRWQDLDFLASTQARASGERFLQVKRAQWIGDAVGEKRNWGLLSGKPAFWNAVALYTQRGIIRDAKAKALAAVGTDIGEANETKEKIDIVQVQIRDEDRKIRVDDNGTIHIPAAATSKPTRSNRKILFTDSSLGGKQLHYGPHGSRSGLRVQLRGAGRRQVRAGR